MLGSAGLPLDSLPLYGILEVLQEVAENLGSHLIALPAPRRLTMLCVWRPMSTYPVFQNSLQGGSEPGPSYSSVAGNKIFCFDGTTWIIYEMLT